MKKKKMTVKKNTMYCKEKGRSSSPIYKANVLVVYFIKQNTIFFCRVFSVWSDIWLIAYSILKSNPFFLNHMIHNHYLVFL
jgi:hypothetical protein